MPSNTDTDKQNDNLEQASKAEEKFIAFKKRMFWLGIGFLIAAIVLSLPIYFFLETSNNILGVGIFSCVGLAEHIDFASRNHHKRNKLACTSMLDYFMYCFPLSISFLSISGLSI
ncbi:hypothetical protein RAM19_08290 [Bartonella apihabitans]|nr:hypothetical protein [Bartonella apihabitans]WLT08089.1 hypothetical protein RAM19_08290 [Bartonella apihabitans]